MPPNIYPLPGRDCYSNCRLLLVPPHTITNVISMLLKAVVADPQNKTVQCKPYKQNTSNDSPLKPWMYVHALSEISSAGFAPEGE